MSDAIQDKSHGGDVHVEKAIVPVDDSHALDQKAEASAYKAAAIEAENAEHDMGVLQAVKEYPMAAFWAFVMSCTIVRFHCGRNLYRNFSNKVSDHGSLLCVLDG